MIDSVTFILTEACNMRCKYCFEQEYKYQNKYMNDKTIEKTLRLLLNQDNVNEFSINLFGGEPTLNNKCIEKVIEILTNTNKNVLLTITTNLFILNKDIFRKLNILSLKSNIDIEVTVSGILNEKYHDEDRIDANGKGTYKQTVDNLEYCLKNFENLKIGVHSVISKKNMKNITEIIDSSLNFKLKHPSLYKNSFALVSVASLKDSNDEYTKEEFKFYYEDYVYRNKEKYNICNKYIEDMYFPIIYSFDLLENTKLTVCRAMKTEITIGTDGNISPCHRSDIGIKEKDIKTISYGNINDVLSIEEIERNIPNIENIKDDGVKFISELNNEECSKCSFNSMCHTCIMANYNLIGNFNYKSKGECLRTMTMAELTIEYERVKLMKEIKKELSEMKEKINNLGEITTINTEALVELLKNK